MRISTCHLRDESVSFVGAMEALERLLAGMPEDPEQQLTALLGLNRLVRAKIAGLLSQSLQQQYQHQQQETFEEKQRIVEKVSEVLRACNLAILYEGQACNLVAAQDNANHLGRFLLVPIGQRAPVLTRNQFAKLLPLAFIDRPARREPLKEWRKRS